MFVAVNSSNLVEFLICDVEHNKRVVHRNTSHRFAIAAEADRHDSSLVVTMFQHLHFVRRVENVNTAVLISDSNH